MLTLAIDTALQSCSAAILDDNQLLAHQMLSMEKGHAEHLAPLVAEVVYDAGIALCDLDRVGVTIGPGGFTGIRVGLSFARGLAIGSTIEVVGVNTLAALATSQRGEKDIAVFVGGPRGQVYAALLRPDLLEVVTPFMATEEAAIAKIDAVAAADIRIIGSMRGRKLNHPSAWYDVGLNSQISIVDFAQLCQTLDPQIAMPVPLYLRAPDAAPAKPSFFADLLP